MDANGFWHGLTDNQKHQAAPPRVLVIGAGARGNAYARAITNNTAGIIAAVAEPIEHKRTLFGKRYIWKTGEAQAGQAFADWRHFLKYELEERRSVSASKPRLSKPVDAVLVCTLDTQHAEIIKALAPLKLHVMSEKPLATTLHDCLDIWASLLPEGPQSTPCSIFQTGHVLRYSPHNMLLRKLVLQDHVVGDVLSVEHTEPVGWWHFSHSYVRGNWRKESTAAPSLLTKSGHDIDFLLWLLTAAGSPQDPDGSHQPSSIASTGHLSMFRKDRKPVAAGDATNCLSCPMEASCLYSARKIYLERFLDKGHTDWPIAIVDPEIEDCYHSHGKEAAKDKLLSALGEDYNRGQNSQEEIDQRPWFGRCVWESDNDVCDDQFVTIKWDDEPSPSPEHKRLAKTANFHMVAGTQAQCQRRGFIYGTTGELRYDGETISIYDFASGQTHTHTPSASAEGHGGGDLGLATQFILAVQAVKSGVSVVDAQKNYIGCTLEDIIRSHAVVFAAEESRRNKSVVEWASWWRREVEDKMMQRKGWDVIDQ